MLKNLIDEAATKEQFTFEWLLGHFPDNIYGFIVLFLSLLSLLPIINIAASPVLLLIFCQIMLGYKTPVLPKKFLRREYPVRYLLKLDHYALPLLLRLEKFVRPRWLPLLMPTRRISACVAFVFTLISLFIPLPFASIPNATICILLSLAYIEHDGLLLLSTLFISIGAMILVLMPIVHSWKGLS